MKKYKFSVILAEDELVIHEDIKQKIQSINSRFQVIASATTGYDALNLVKEHTPDLLITDIQMPSMDGIELIKQIRIQFPEMLIVIISGFDDFQYAQTALKYNVVDYLLKPVSVDTLSSLLFELESRLNLQYENEQKEIFLRDLKGLSIKSNEIEKYGPIKIGIFFVNVGNLHSKASISLQQEEYYTIIESNRFNKACNDILSYSDQIYIMDERIPNQKCILVLQSDTMNISIPNKSIELHKKLNSIFSPVPVSICTVSSPINSTELRLAAGKLRKLMDNALILCRGKVFIEDQKKTYSLNINTDLVNMRFSKLIRDGDYTSFKNEFLSYFLPILETGYTQRQFENLLILFIKNLVFNTDGILHDDIDNSIHHIYDISAFSINSQSMLKEITEVIMQLCWHDRHGIESGKEAVVQIADYLKTNFRNQISIDDLSSHFGFNSSYLIRLFNKYMDVTPAQFIINLRINEAKKLLQNNDKLLLKQISEFCGYADQHYFSRLFKQVTGISPSAYREKLNSK